MNKLVLYNKKKWLSGKLKMVSFSLAFSAFIGGCTVNRNNNENINFSNPNSINTDIYNDNKYSINSISNDSSLNLNNTDTDNSTVVIDYIEDDAINDIKLLSEFELSTEEVNYITGEIDKISVDYDKSNMFQIDENLTKYNDVKIDNYESSLNIVENNKVNYDLLYRTILDNNQKYKDEQGSSFYNMDINNDLLNQIVKIISDNINKKLSDDNYINISELNYTLTNLKIFTYVGFGAGGVNDQDDVLSINMNTISSYQQQYPDIDPLEMTVKHECNHLIQARPQVDLSNQSFSSNYGFCYKFNNTHINSLYNSWIFEAASEKLVLNDYNDDRKPLVYDYYIKALESLTLSTILQDDVSSTEIENLTFQHDLSLVFDQFGAKTDYQKQEVLEMLYAFELINTDGNEFRDNYKERYGQRFDLYAMDDYRLSLKGSVSLTLTKVFYTNLLKSVENKSVSIEDIYQLISIFEDEISRITWYSSKNSYFPEFIENYQKIQMMIFEIIAEKTDLSINEVVNFYNNYHKNLEVYHQIDWLNDDKNKFFSNIFLTRRNQRKESIIEVYNNNFNNVIK